jgi:leucine-zipper-like transcriptional regulator 1
MFLFGGHDGARQLNDFYCFNFSKFLIHFNRQLATEMWTLVESETQLTPSPRDSHILVNSGNSIFLFGGSTGNPRSDFYEFKIDEAKWVAVSHKGGKAPTSRFCHVGIVLKKRFYIFGGYDGDSRLNDFHYFLIDERTFEIPHSTLIADLSSFVASKVIL